MDAWNRTMSLEWTPSLRFYERKIQLLQGMERRGLLAAYAVQEGLVGLLVGDRAMELIVTSRSCSLRLSGSTFDRDRLFEAIGMILRTVEPMAIRATSYSSQHLAALSDSYEEGKSRFIESFFDGRSSNIGLDDMAVLVDGQDPEHETSYQVEFGVVSADEIPDRLNRHAGRMEAQESLSPYDWSTSGFPAVALFVDSSWELNERANGSDGSVLMKRLLEEAEGRADRLANGLWNSLGFKAVR
jgi:hypothetical protein